MANSPRLDTDVGLSAADAGRALAEDGPNELPASQATPRCLIRVPALTPLNDILLVVVSSLLGPCETIRP